MCALCVVCFAPGTAGHVSVMGPGSVQGCPGDTLPFRLLVQLELLQCPLHCASGTQTGLNARALAWASQTLCDYRLDELRSHVVQSSDPYVRRPH